MAAVLVRRTLATGAVVGLALATAPLLGTAGATATAPALKSSYPAAGAYIVSGGETLSATYDQQISTKSTFVVKNGAGNGIPGTVKLASSSQLGGTTDTITFSPSTSLSSGQYTASITVDAVDSKGNDNPALSTSTTFGFGVDTRAPQSPSGPSNISNVNENAVPFTGTAAPGVTVEVDISNSQDPSGSTVAKGSATVPACSSAPNCPWTVKVDAHNLPDDTHYQWDAFASDASGATSPATAKTAITKDTTPPSAPTGVTATWVGSDFQTLQVSATKGSSEEVNYNVTVADPEGHTVSSNGIAHDGSGNLPATDIGVGTLDDGSPTVSVYAVDTTGNVSQAAHPSSNPADKTAGIAIDFSGSTFTTPSGTVTFPDAAAHVIQPPTAVNIHLTNAVDPAFTDDLSPTGPKTYNAQVCIADNTGTCVVISSSPTLSADARTMSVPISSPLADSGSPYTVYVRAFDLNECKDRQTPTGWTCYTLSGKVTDNVGAAAAMTQVNDASGNQFAFALDSTPPVVAFTGFSPSPVTSTTVSAVSISGTASNDTTAVQIVIKSSGGGSALVVNVPVTPNPSAGSLSWSASPVNLSTVRDGTLTVSATATDVAGNTTPTPVVLNPSPLLEAHLSWLTEYTSNRVVTYGRLIRLRGRLTDNNGAAIAGATLTIKPRFDNKKFGRAITTTTDSNGYWSRLLAPAHNATYWVSYAGTNVAGAVHDAVTVHRARTLVRVRMTWISPRNGAHVGAPVVLKGSASPNKRGTYVYIYRHTKTRNFLLGRVRLGRTSRWAFSVTLPRGTTLVFVKIRNTYGNVGNRTTYRKLVR